MEKQSMGEKIEGVMVTCQKKKEHKTIGGKERPYFESCQLNLYDDEGKVLETIDAKELRFSATEGAMPTEIEVEQMGSAEKESSGSKKSSVTGGKPKGVRPEWTLEKEPKTPAEKRIAHEEVERIKKKGRK